jgi:hypothetical protein
MRRLYLAILLPTATILSLPSCETVPAGEQLAFRDVDICVLVNEPPDSSGDEAGDPADLQLFPPCTEPAGCTEPASGFHYYTYFDAVGGYTNVSGECPPPQPNPKVEAETQAEAEELCHDLYGSLCRSLCDCHGGTAVMEAGSVDSCAENTTTGIYACGCTCSLPE